MKIKKAFITGINGQDGSYLTELLLKKNYIVHGLRRRTSSLNTSRIDHLFHNKKIINKKLFLYHGDMTDGLSLSNLIRKIKPDEIYNLAAQSHVHVSFESPEYTSDTDALGTLRLLENLKNYLPKSKFYQASTSEIYGNNANIPQDEDTPFNPASPYGVSKLYAFHICKNYREAYNLFCCNGILFNHESPRRGETFVTRKISRHIANYYLGSREVLKIGNLDSKRDWGHAKDYVEAMWKMLQLKTPADYVIATGESHSVREFIEIAFRNINITVRWKGKGLNEVGYDQKNKKTLIKVSKEFFRPKDINMLLGNPLKAKKILKWKSKISFRELVKEMVDSDIANLKK